MNNIDLTIDQTTDARTPKVLKTNKTISEEPKKEHVIVKSVKREPVEVENQHSLIKRKDMESSFNEVENPHILVKHPERNTENSLNIEGQKRIIKLKEKVAQDIIVENELTEGKPIKGASEVDKKREVVLKKATKVMKIIVPNYFDKEIRQAMKETEEGLTEPFAKYVYGKMAEANRQILLDHLIDSPISQDDSEIIYSDRIGDGSYNIVCFSDNGYLMQLTNKEAVENNKNIEFDSENALYNIIDPRGRIISEKLDYNSAFNELEEKSGAYQKELSAEFLDNSGK